MLSWMLYQSRKGVLLVSQFLYKFCNTKKPNKNGLTTITIYLSPVPLSLNISNVDPVTRLWIYLFFQYIQGAVRNKCPRFFFVYRRKLTHTKTQQRTFKASKHSRCTVFLRVWTGGVNFAFYPSSSIHVTSSLFMLPPLFSSASTTDGVCCPPGPDINKKE